MKTTIREEIENIFGHTFFALYTNKLMDSWKWKLACSDLHMEQLLTPKVKEKILKIPYVISVKAVKARHRHGVGGIVIKFSKKPSEIIIERESNTSLREKVKPTAKKRVTKPYIAFNKDKSLIFLKESNMSTGEVVLCKEKAAILYTELTKFLELNN